MLTRAQEKLIRSLHNKAGRQKTALCLVEGLDLITAARDQIEFEFTPDDTLRFTQLVTTQAPQPIAAVARIPEWSSQQVMSKPLIIVLDGVQDPGNVGAILRAALGFEASVLLIESADPGSPKVLRASVGSVFQVPWQTVPRTDAVELIDQLGGFVVRLENHLTVTPVITLEEFTQSVQRPRVLIAGSEGQGIQLPIQAPSLTIAHTPALESLNVSQAVTIVCHALYASSHHL